jgi:hypothetical protein
MLAVIHYYTRFHCRLSAVTSKRTFKFTMLRSETVQLLAAKLVSGVQQQRSWKWLRRCNSCVSSIYCK